MEFYVPNNDDYIRALNAYQRAFNASQSDRADEITIVSGGAGYIYEPFPFDKHFEIGPHATITRDEFDRMMGD